MYILCYESTADDATKDQLWNLIKQGQQGFISDRMVSTRFYIPERLAPWALIIDSTLTRKPYDDYIA
jgi:hypothetical protein